MLSEIFISVSVFAACFGIVYVAVTAKNRERLAMIDKGMNPFENKKVRKSNSHTLLKWSLLIIGLGLGVFIGSILETTTALPQVAAYFGSILFFGGVGLAVAYLIAKKHKVE